MKIIRGYVKSEKDIEKLKEKYIGKKVLFLSTASNNPTGIIKDMRWGKKGLDIEVLIEGKDPLKFWGGEDGNFEMWFSMKKIIEDKDQLYFLGEGLNGKLVPETLMSEIKEIISQYWR